MPTMTGIELLELLIKRQNTLPVLMMSAHSDVQWRFKHAAGARDFIIKPFEAQELIEKTRKFINENIHFQDSCPR